MRSGLTISVVGHVVALGFGLLAISATPMDTPPVDSLPVSFISDKDFSQMTQGVKNAPKPKEDPKPLADKIDLPKPADQTADKVAKQEVKTETAPPKQQPQPDPKPAEKQAKPKPPSDFKPDQISQLLKKDFGQAAAEAGRQAGAGQGHQGRAQVQCRSGCPIA